MDNLGTAVSVLVDELIGLDSMEDGAVLRGRILADDSYNPLTLARLINADPSRAIFKAGLS
jgi:hypothetical protein